MEVEPQGGGAGVARQGPAAEHRERRGGCTKAAVDAVETELTCRKVDL